MIDDDDIKRMRIEEFRETGYLQEVNRQWFHPLGLALEIERDVDGDFVLGGIWDYREDPEGMLFVDLTNDTAYAKQANVQRELNRHVEARTKLLDGSVIQPLGTKFPRKDS